MKLHLIRHAIAADGGGSLPDDARPLTREGRERFAEVVRGLARLETKFDLLLHSPLLRAVQTAELLVPLLHGQTRVSAHLASAPSPELLGELTGRSVAVVGHEPWLGELLAWLATGDAAKGHVFAFKKGGVAVLEGNARPGDMMLLAVLPPSVLRELGRGK